MVVPHLFIDLYKNMERTNAQMSTVFLCGCQNDRILFIYLFFFFCHVAACVILHPQLGILVL